MNRWLTVTRTGSLVSIRLMGIGARRVSLIGWRVGVLVGMRFRAIPREIVRVPMVPVMHMRMGVRERRGRVPVRMGFGQVQPHAGTHQ